MSHAVPTPQYRRVLRVFLSSPGDVTDERALARHLLKDELPYEAFLRGRVMFEPVSWDDPAAPVPMQADRTPQETVNRSRPRPSECDFVVIILWSRLGTPLPEEHCKADGGRYLSGTEWEYEDALKATPRPNILVYRRMETPMMAVNDPAKDEKAEQWERLERFFSRFKNPDGSLQGGVTEYQTPSMFADRLKSDLRELVAEMEPQPSHFSKLDGMISPETAGAETWPGSPYPGLRAFKPDLVLLSAGFDAYMDDPLGGMRVTADCFGRLTASLAAIADECCQGRLVAVTEGGYDLKGLADCLRATIGALDTRAPATSGARGDDTPRADATIRAVRPHLAKYWRL